MPTRISVLVSLLLSMLLAESALGVSSVSYRSLTDKEDERNFYGSGGRDHARERVHLHVPASVLLARPFKVVDRPGIGRQVLFRNRSVPLAVRPDNVYVRKIRQRADPGDVLCVKGTVNDEPLAAEGRFALYVHAVKKALDHDD